MRNIRCGLVTMLFALCLAPSLSFASIKNLNISQIFHQPGQAVYLLSSHAKTPLRYTIKTDKGIRVNSLLSTCRNVLLPGGECKLYVNGKSGDIHLQTPTGETIIPLAANRVVNKRVSQFNAAGNNIQWQALSGPSGGQITDIISLPNNPQTMFAIAYGSGVYKTTNGGKNWVSANKGLTINTGILKIVYFNGALYVFSGKTIYKSTDDAESWQLATNKGIGSSIVELLPADNNLYAADQSSIYRLNGDSWQKLGDLPVVDDMQVSPMSFLVNLNTIIVGTYRSGIYRSIDGGKTFVAANQGLAHTDIQFTALLNAKGIIFVGCDNVYNDGAIYKSTNDGKTWTKSDSGLEQYGISALVLAGNTLYAGTSISSKFLSSGGVFKSTDKGESWQRVDDGLVSKLIYSLHATKSNVYVGTDNDLQVSDDGGSQWTTLEKGIDAHWIGAVYITPNGSFIAATMDGAMYASDDDGKTWTLAQGINLEGILIAHHNSLTSTKDGTLYLANNNLYRSTDNGKTWNIVKLPNTDPIFPMVVKSVLASNNKIYVGTAAKGVKVSIDNGKTWQPLTAKQSLNNVYRLFEINNILYAGLQDGLLSKTSAAGGQAWKASDLDLYNSNMGGLSSITGIGDNVFISFESDSIFYHGGVYMSKNAGNSWESLNSDLPTKFVTSLISRAPSGPKGPITLLATASQGVFMSFDSGVTWSKQNLGLVNNDYANDIYTNGNKILLGTISGVYMAELPASA